MRLDYIDLTNFRPFLSQVILFPERLTLLEKDRIGKTSILDAISMSLGTFFLKMNGPHAPQLHPTDALRISGEFFSQYPVKISASGEIFGEKVKWTRSLESSTGRMSTRGAKRIIEFSAQTQKQLQDGDSSLILPVLAYYNATTLLNPDKTSIKPKYSTRINGYIDALYGKFNQSLMNNWFFQAVILDQQRQEIGISEENSILNVVYNAMSNYLAKMLDCVNHSIRYSLTQRDFSIDFSDQSAACIFSQGYKPSLILATDIIYRMATLNPQLMGDLTEETPGVVLVDNVDMLHPEWRETIIPALMETFPKVQFIVAVS